MTNIPPAYDQPAAYPAQAERLFPRVMDWSVLTVECAAGQYSASLLSRAVEDCDAHVLNLNVVSGLALGEPSVVELRVNHRNPELVARSLERYGYTVTSVMSSAPGSDPDDDSGPDAVARRRVNELIRLLNV
ncbi:MAG: hypothetical protein HDR90_01300 [Bacteroides sp.]|nr:hypothetical protein [Bacteroides sp.]